jgi:uncharacterized protein
VLQTREPAEKGEVSNQRSSRVLSCCKRISEVYNRRMNPSGLRGVSIKYLSGHNVLNLATSGPGGIWGAAVFYASEEFTVYFLSSPESRHSVNLAANPRVACTIQEDYRDWHEIRGIQLEGTATMISGVEQARAIALYASKFPLIANLADRPAEIAAALRQISWYRVDPSRVFFLDNSLGFGHREIVYP